MGWKCDLVVVDDATRRLEELLAAFVGGPLRPAAPLALDDAIGPAPPLGAIRLAGRAALFSGSVRPLIAGSTPALEGRLMRAARGRAVLALHLDSTCNGYGWASWVGGERVRTRLGLHPDVLRDDGPPLRTEREVLRRFEPQGGGRYRGADGEVWTHDQLGEEFVFALLEAALGLRPDDGLPDVEVARFEVDAARARSFLDVEGEERVFEPAPEDVAGALHALRATGPSFAILETGERGYVQAGGSGRALVVEGRLSGSRGTFRHASATRRGATRPRRHVPMSGGGVRVPANEVLDVEAAVRIFVEFLRSGTLSASVGWRDRTAEFA